MTRLHLVGIGVGIANSVTYFLHSVNFSYGIRLVRDGEMEFDEVLR